MQHGSGHATVQERSGKTTSQAICSHRQRRHMKVLFLLTKDEFLPGLTSKTLKPKQEDRKSGKMWNPSGKKDNPNLLPLNLHEQRMFGV